MDKIAISDVLVTPLKKIPHEMGDVYHGIKKSDRGYLDFGEAYFSAIKYRRIKPWKKHLKMTLNLIVPVGKIKFVLFDDREGSNSFNCFSTIEIGFDNYFRLTVPPNIWMAFQGMDEGLNLLLNVADLAHDPQEFERLNLDDIKYTW